MNRDEVARQVHLRHLNYADAMDALIDSELRIQGLREALGNLCMEVESMESLDGRVSNEAWKAKERAEALLSEEKK